MKNGIVGIVLAASAICLMHSAAKAQQNVAIGQATSPPIGWLQFCQDHPTDCIARQRRPMTIRLDETSWRKIVTINAEVNREIEPVTDMDHWGVPELWSYPTDGKGDCEDYVLEKRRRLIAAGFPANALLITVVRDLKGEGHAVLTIKTDRGDFVLDNQIGKIVAWMETGYRFIKRQSDEDPSRWVSLGGIDTRTVAAQR
jgi:predicted transglutaminase-like cysteine proteinase